MTDGPSPHFAWDEFRCHDEVRTPYPLDWRTSRAVPLAYALERVRARLGAVLHRDVPLWLTSVYRTPAWNRTIKGRRLSQHLEGRAADVVCPFRCPYQTFREAILFCAADPDSQIRYVCFYPNQGFAHLDIRPTDKLVVEDAT